MDVLDTRVTDLAGRVVADGQVLSWGTTSSAMLTVMLCLGILMSIVMQSSTAAGAATLVALNAGSLTRSSRAAR